MQFIKFVYIGVGGALGALSRTLLAELVRMWQPLGPAGGTLTVNLLGCLVLGTVTGAAEPDGSKQALLNWFLISGFLGAFTTFSTFQADAVGLWGADKDRALLYLTLSVVGGAIAFVAGVKGVEVVSPG